ncbi:MAG TPA: EVE domain-containing protein [Candidatus Methylomirabilis sp.]|nr:EVE domain-containing protein [Candidatus Methylomirabilis sp.]
MNHWLMKSEPDVFGIADLKSRPNQTEHWDGVRNYQARNFLRAMQRGDEAFFYHSSCANPGVAGIVRIVRSAYPDPSAWDPESPFHDPRSAPEKPVWLMVDVKLVRELKRVILLHELKANAALKNMRLVSRGSRLSVMPVTAKEWNAILKMERD